MKLLAAFAATLALAPPVQAAGYSYATLTAPKHLRGLAATVTLAAEPRLAEKSHTASWVGIGTTRAWVQVGVETDPGFAPMLYYEVANGPRYDYFPLREVRVGESVRIGIYEVSPGRWIVLSPAGILGPFRVTGSHRLDPQVAAESYTAGSHNAVSYTLGQVEAPQLDGRWYAVRHFDLALDRGWSSFGLTPALVGFKLS